MPPKRRKQPKRKADESVDSPLPEMKAECSKFPIVDAINATYDKNNKRVNYVLKFSSRCSCGSPKLTTSAAYNVLVNSDDPAIDMMKKTIALIEKHELDSSEDGVVTCDLDLAKFDFVMTNDLMWRGLWFQVQQQVNKDKEEAKERSDILKKRHAEKAAATAKKPWEEGAKFTNTNTKNKAVTGVMALINQHTGKSIAQVRELMPAITTRLNKAIDGLDCVVRFGSSKRQKTMETMFETATSCIKSLTSNNNNAQLLTGVAALFLPPTPVGNNNQSESVH